MMDILFNGVGWTGIAITLNRIAVGLFFMLSGYHKLNPERHRALADQLKGLGVHAVGFNQWWVPTVEFTAGLAVVIGFVAPLAALGLLVIILVAVVTSGRQRINVYKPIDEGDRIDDWLYLPEILYAFFTQGETLETVAIDLKTANALDEEIDVPGLATAGTPPCRCRWALGLDLSG
jgi:uncharacterized membrane protein YphA (DoxX/SURF4 family)